MSHRGSQGHGNPSDNNATFPNWIPPIVSPRSSVHFEGQPGQQNAPMNLGMLPPYPSNPIPQDPEGPSNSYGNKVAIPRIVAPTTNRGRRRSARACEACRQRKIKCDGVKPTCGQCSYHNNQCSYEDVKRVRDQKELKFLGQRVENYENLLRSLEEEVEPPTARRIRRTLKVSIFDSKTRSSLSRITSLARPVK